MLSLHDDPEAAEAFRLQDIEADLSVLPINLDAFMSRVEFEANTGCWLWSGAPLMGAGYGRVGIGKRTYRAHCLSWAIHHGEMPAPGLVIRHRCDTPACVNPAHLLAGTQADNIADMLERGRHCGTSQRGADNPKARLSEADFFAIRDLIATAEMSLQQIADRYSVSRGHVNDIRKGRTWRHLKCDVLPLPPSDGPGTKRPSLAKTRPSTKASPRPASTPSAASPTASGSTAHSSPRGSGGRPAKSTPKPANCSATSAAAPKSMERK